MVYPFEENVLDAMQQVGNLTGVDLNAFDFDEVLDWSEELAEAGYSLWFANGGLVSTIALGMVACDNFDDVADSIFYWGCGVSLHRRHLDLQTRSPTNTTLTLTSGRSGKTAKCCWSGT